MDKIIRAKDLFVALRDDIEIDGSNFARVMDHLKNVPAVKIAHGTWVNVLADDQLGRQDFRCSICGNKAPIEERYHEYGGRYTCTLFTPYCPNCGAKMTGGE